MQCYILYSLCFKGIFGLHKTVTGSVLLESSSMTLLKRVEIYYFTRNFVAMYT